MTTPLHWELRNHLKDFAKKSTYPRLDIGMEYRLPVLLSLLLHANARLRVIVSTETIMNEVGADSEATVIAVLKWLLWHGALYFIPEEERAGWELGQQDGSDVFQLTGVIRFVRHVPWVRYLLLSDESVTEMVGGWNSSGMGAPDGFDYTTIQASKREL